MSIRILVGGLQRDILYIFSLQSELQCRAQELQDLKTILSEIPQYEQMLQSSLEQRICVACLRQNQTSADAE